MQNHLNIKSPAAKIAEEHASGYGLINHGLSNTGTVYWNLSVEALYEEALYRQEGLRAQQGPLCVTTGQHTDYSTCDKLIVYEPTTKDKINWGQYNRPLDRDSFNILFGRVLGYLQGRDVFVQDCYTGADPNYKLPIRIITEHAWQSLSARNMFLRSDDLDEIKNHVPEFTVICVPGFKGVPQMDSTASETFIVINFQQKICLIGGTAYSGEIKKAIFTVLNYHLPLNNILTLNSSANIGEESKTALFMGLSGTGKTTLSADPERKLVGDDEHAWSDDGIFNIENGGYAKVHLISADDQPQIYACTEKFGTILENADFDEATGQFDLSSNKLTDNIRATYPLEFIENSVAEKTADHPKHIFMLTCDTTGVLPPISRLTTEQAIYHYLSGYSSELTGSEPETIFSPCFDAECRVHSPHKYANMLRDKLQRYGTTCWLVNTGWTSGEYGTGKRISVNNTRAIIKAACSGQLDKIEYRIDPVFGFEIPTSCPEVSPEILDPANGWTDKDSYNQKSKQLASLFTENFKKLSAGCSPEIISAGPKLN